MENFKDTTKIFTLDIHYINNTNKSVRDIKFKQKIFRKESKY
jgi:hypothetical protein